MMTEQPHTQSWHPLLALTLITALGLASWIGFRFATRTSEAHLMSWVGPNNKPLFGTKKPIQVNCRGGTRWQLMARGRHAWSVCPEGLFTATHTSLYRSGILVRFSLDQRTAYARWPLPKHLAHNHTVGLLPGPPHTIAIVYRANSIEGPLVVGIANQRGWSHPPTPLTSPAGQSAPRGRLLGIAWQQKKLLLAWSPGNIRDPRGINSPLHLLQLTPQKPTPQLSATLPLQQLCPHARCQIIAAYQHQQKWQLIAQKTPLPPANLDPAGPTSPLAKSSPIFAIGLKRPIARSLRPLLAEIRTTRLKIPIPKSLPNGKGLILPTSQPANQPTRKLENQPTSQPKWKGESIGALTLDGHWTPRPSWRPYAFMMRQRLDLTLAGLLPMRPLALSKRLTPTGELVSLPAPPRFHMQLRRQGGQFVYDQGALRMRHRWRYQTPAAQAIHDQRQRPPGAQRAVHHLEQALSKKARSEGILLQRTFDKVPYFHKGKRRWHLVETRLKLQRLDAYEVTHSQILARSPAITCITPAKAMLIPLAHGQHWLLHPNGCHIVLNRQWRRQDPTPLSTTYQLYKARSLWHQYRILWQFGALAWAFAGLPLCWLFGWLLTPMVQRRQQQIQATPEAPQSLKRYPGLTILVATCLYLAIFAALWPTLEPFF